MPKHSAGRRRSYTSDIRQRDWIYRNVFTGNLDVYRRALIFLRMKVILIFLLLATLCVPVLAVHLDNNTTTEQTETDAPEGMVIHRFGSNSIVAPKDARVTVTGGRINVEDPAHYIARTTSNFEKRLAEFQKKLDIIEKRLNITSSENNTSK
jgi:hypothetical protein